MVEEEYTADGPAEGVFDAEGGEENTSSAPGVETQADDVTLETGPIVWPVVAVMGTIVGVAVIVVLLLISDPERVGGPEFAELVTYAVLLLAGVALLRYSVKLLVLRKTRYVIDERGFRREYALLYRRQVREVPVEQLRGEEFVQGRFQTLFGCATIRLLTGGTDHSLGFIEFESVRDPSRVFSAIQNVQAAADDHRAPR